MDISEEELKELKDYEKEEQKLAAQKGMLDDYEKLVELMDYPPLNLLINSQSFSEALSKAFNEVPKKEEYDRELFGKIEKKFKFEIDSARKAIEKYKTPQKASREYMKTHKNVDITDFSNIYLIRYAP
jgi:hypothetical protein